MGEEENEFTVSSLELGRAPVNKAIKILVRVLPRGTITLSLIDIYCFPTVEFPRSNISDKKLSIELEASLQQK